jgi:AAHS family 4-hydroxybenzoate transporter-like MFS transporter
VLFVLRVLFCGYFPLGKECALSKRHAVEIAEILNKNKISRFQTGLFVLSGVCLMMAGFDVQVLGYLAPAIIKDWQLAPAQMGPVLSAVLFGILIGSFLCSTIADRIGRRPVLVAATIFFAVVTLLCARAESIGELRTLRFIAGIGLGGIMPNAVALIGEYSPLRLRVLIVLVVTNSFNIGAMIAGLVSAWLVQGYGWKSVLVVGGAIPLAIGGLMFWLLPESLQFMALRGKDRAKIGKAVQRIDRTVAIDSYTDFVVHEKKAAGVPLLYLLSDGRLTGTLLLWVVNFMNLLNIYFLAGWLPTIVSASYSLRASQLIGTTLQVGGVLGTFVFSWLIGRLGFVPVLASAFFTACVSVALIGQPALPLTALFAVVFVSGLCIIGSQAAINAMGGQYYPTDLRSTGVGAALGVGRVGGILGPSVAGVFVGAGWMPRDIFYAAAAPALISAATMLALRRQLTKNGRS